MPSWSVFRNMYHVESFFDFGLKRGAVREFCLKAGEEQSYLKKLFFSAENMQNAIEGNFISRESVSGGSSSKLSSSSRSKRK
jgi:hypothetical protein